MDNQQFLIVFGASLKKKRKEKNLSLSKLAAECGYEKSNMSRMESGKANPTLLTLLKICRALDIPVKDLFIEAD